MHSSSPKKIEPDQEPGIRNLFPGGRVMSEQLLGGRGTLIIEHDGREYRLRLTRSGKLILTA